LTGEAKPGAGASSAVVVAGPRIVPDGVDAVRGFARATRVGVLNTFGAKGLFRWDDPAHFGTIGLQARDVELAGVLDADIVLAIGLDDRELGPADLGPKVTVLEPGDLDGWRDRVKPAPRGPLYERLRAALLPLYESDRVPVNPAAAVSDVAGILPPEAVVCADPGPVGLWIARALPTIDLGSVYVPAAVNEGLALLRASELAATGRAVLYVTDRHATTGTAPDGVVVEIWTAQGEPRTREQRRNTLADALGGRCASLLTTAVDLSLTTVLTDVAGPVTAWSRP
jgi:hypothetical protein